MKDGVPEDEVEARIRERQLLGLADHDLDLDAEHVRGRGERRQHPG